MSRGPGRLQRAILMALADYEPKEREKPVTVNRRDGHRELQRMGELTTYQITSRLSDQGWWWDDTLERQVRRGLDRLHAVGLVEKRFVPNYPHYSHATRSLWWLAETKPVPDEGTTDHGYSVGPSGPTE